MVQEENIFRSLTQCYLIAEIGVNHNGSVSLAKELILHAKESGAQAVKFQTFNAEKLVSPQTPKVDYQLRTSPTDESHFQMLKKLELSRDAHCELYEFSADVGIDFLSTPYDLESAIFLNKLGVKFFKTASADIVDLPLHMYLASTKKPVVIATGMSNLGEIERVIKIYSEQGSHNLALLHCVSNYPCSDESINLRALTTLEKCFGYPVGYSDHSKGVLAAALSIAYGAIVIEKHFTLDKSMAGPDHLASANPEEFSALVREVRRAENMLGSGFKLAQPEEQMMAEVSRKSLHFSRNKSKGEIIMPEDLELKRPGNGIPYHFLGHLIGRVVLRDCATNQMVDWDIVGYRS